MCRHALVLVMVRITTRHTLQKSPPSLEIATMTGHGFLESSAVNILSSKYTKASTATLLVIFLAGSGAWLTITAELTAQERTNETSFVVDSYNETSTPIFQFLIAEGKEKLKAYTSKVVSPPPRTAVVRNNGRKIL